MRLKIPYWYLLLGPTLAFWLGYGMNALVMAANNGQMPVLWPGGCAPETADFLHSCMTAKTHLKFLADWIVEHHAVASPGDYLERFYDKSFGPGPVAWVALMIRDKHKAY